MDINRMLADEFSVRPDLVSNIVSLIDEGNTIPFIARYRKEKTGSMDDQLLRTLADRLEYLRGLDKRRTEITEAIRGQEKLTPELEKSLLNAETLAQLEDLYLPFRPKRRTRGGIARERGLEPLAAQIFAQKPGSAPALEAAAALIDPEKGVESAADALAGALDIIAEDLSDDARLRGLLRSLTFRTGVIVSKAAVREDSVYAMYYDFREAASRIAPHRVLALDRGEREKMLKVTVEVDPQQALSILTSGIVRRNDEYGDLVRQAAEDAYARLIAPSLERELRADLTARADEGAIRVFSDNLRQLLLQPPIRGKVALGMDPGYRMGCKLAVVDPTGRVLTTTVIYPVPPQSRIAEAKAEMLRLIRKYGVEIIAIGNGTASRETEIFCADVLREAGGGISYMVVSESGASVYSASKLAAEEFPDFDVNVRSAVSIARRLQDPLAELVKIDPKAVGVGQYQHDMPAARLNSALDGVVEQCVNTVGVDLNTASPSLLSHVAGISGTVAKNIVARRETDGPYRGRRELLKVAKLGPRAFEQCAGFLRIPGASEPLDGTAVHPESYAAADALLSLCGCTPADIGTPAISALGEKLKILGKSSVAQQLGIGLPTLEDICAELRAPGRDVRDSLPKPLLRTDILSLDDLKPGMELEGTVRNVVDFGAFVDIGVHQDGLVHISRISDRYVKKASDVLKVGDVIHVWVLGVDPVKKRISLSAVRPKPGETSAPARAETKRPEQSGKTDKIR